MLAQLELLWSRHRRRLWQLALVLSVIALWLRLGGESFRLLYEPERSGGVDLSLRYEEVHAWFSGVAVYDTFGARAAYPPATYAMLWPWLGWVELRTAHWLWLVLCGLGLSALAWQSVRLTGVRERVPVLVALATPLASYAPAAALGTGQPSVVLLPAGIAALWLARTPERSPTRDLLIAALLVLALTKPSLSIPLFWGVLFARGGWRPAVATALGYLLLTALAARFQPAGLLELWQRWMDVAIDGSRIESLRRGYGNLHSWTLALGIPAAGPAASLILLVAGGGWAWWVRRLDPVLGIAGLTLVARLWVHHALYDDVLLLPCLWMAYRSTRSEAGSARLVCAGWLLLLWCGALAPASLQSMDPPWSSLFRGGQSLLWMSSAGMLLWLAQRQRRVAGPGPRVDTGCRGHRAA